MRLFEMGGDLVGLGHAWVELDGLPCGGAGGR